MTKGNAIIRWINARIEIPLIRPHRDFIKATFDTDVQISAISAPRGFGKTWLYAQIIACALTPGSPLWERGVEVLYMAASLEQARIMVQFLRESLADSEDDYRWVDSSQRLLVTHKETATRLRVLSSSGKRSLGLGAGQSIICLDEPAAFDVTNSYTVWDSLRQAIGKRPLKLLVIGTRAPAVDGHWWLELLESGSNASRHVQLYAASPDDAWDSYQTALKANPVLRINPLLRRTVLTERDDARHDTRLKAAYQSYRLNVPTPDESQVLLTVDDWERVLARPVPERDGRPFVAVDLGAGRAWSAACAMWSNGRVEAVAVAPGIPSISAQEKRDRVASGRYQHLVDIGQLRVAHGLRVQPPKQLTDMILDLWGKPRVIVGDRFREGELRDAVKGVRIEPRVSRWSESSEDIRSLRQSAKDGPMSVDADSRDLISASLAVAMVKADDAGNFRLIKRGANNESRDDVAEALKLVAGVRKRRSKRKRKLSYGTT